MVQVYGVPLEGDRAGERALLGFAAVRVPAGQTVPAPVTASLRPLSIWDKASRELTPFAGRLRIEVASYCGDPQRRELEVRLT